MSKLQKILSLILLLMTLAIIVPTQVKAKTTAKHTVFSQKQLENRVKEIQDYYYNKPKQLTIHKKTILLINGKSCNINYYIHGKDLLFAYGTAGKTEYRLYFYKDQLIRLLVDKPGKSRKTYEQLYKRLKSTFYDDKVAQYMQFENYARKEMEYTTAKTEQILDKDIVLITGVTGDTIIYHKLNTYGSDGCLWSIDKKPYKAKLDSNVLIKDFSTNPNKGTKRNRQWLKSQGSGKYLGCAAALDKKGNLVSKITCVYFA